jgi:hypothetical protein
MASSITISVGGREFAARPIGDSSLWGGLFRSPQTVRLAQDQWSGGLLKSLEAALAPASSVPGHAVSYTYQYVGLLGFEPSDGRIVLGYGDAKSQIAELLRPIVPIAVVEHDVEELAKLCNDAQFGGALEAIIAESRSEPPVRPTLSTDFVVTLGDVRANAAFRADADVELAAALRAALPLRGTATNTHSGGPLTRFWNVTGGAEGETPLPLSDGAHMSQVLRPGNMYYLPKRPWRGFRLALREPTIMRSAVAGGANRLAPVAAIIDHLEDLAEVAAQLRTTGQMPMAFEVR